MSSGLLTIDIFTIELQIIPLKPAPPAVFRISADGKSVFKVVQAKNLGIILDSSLLLLPISIASANPISSSSKTSPESTYFSPPNCYRPGPSHQNL